MEQVNHPQHYGGEENIYEAIKVIDAWDLGLGFSTKKYISQQEKGKDKELEDLRNAAMVPPTPHRNAENMDLIERLQF